VYEVGRLTYDSMWNILRNMARRGFGAFHTMIFTKLPPIFQTSDAAGDQQEGHKEHQHAYREHGGDKDPQSQRQGANAKTR